MFQSFSIGTFKLPEVLVVVDWIYLIYYVRVKLNPTQNTTIDIGHNTWPIHSHG